MGTIKRLLALVLTANIAAFSTLLVTGLLSFHDVARTSGAAADGAAGRASDAYSDIRGTPNDNRFPLLPDVTVRLDDD